MCAYENICREILSDTVKTGKEKLAKAEHTKGRGGGFVQIYLYLGDFFKQFEYIPEAT